MQYKYVAMLLFEPYRVHDDVDTTINGIWMEQVQSMKYMGIHISIKKLSWDAQCDKMLF